MRKRKPEIRENLAAATELALGVFAQGGGGTLRLPPDEIAAEVADLLRLKTHLRMAWWQIGVLAGRELETVERWGKGVMAPAPGFVAALRELAGKPGEVERLRRAMLARFGRGGSGVRGRPKRRRRA